MSASLWLAVAGLGGLAAIGRFLLDRAVSARAEHHFPFGTLAVNASASFLLGLASGAALAGSGALLVGSAAVGSYSTFSTWLFETHRLRASEKHHAALANVLASLALGLCAVALGHAIA
ncbi:MAG: fluoride efflux transporter CrcB [Acidobacteriota bacterium]|nr:fluoride efflux transporter CrcB [Acidobacteriota bacterium]